MYKQKNKNQLDSLNLDNLINKLIDLNNKKRMTAKHLYIFLILETFNKKNFNKTNSQDSKIIRLKRKMILMLLKSAKPQKMIFLDKHQNLN